MLPSFKRDHSGKELEAAIKQQVQLAFKGLTGHTKASFIVAEYFNRKQMAKLGFKDDINDLDEVTASAFLLISSEVAKLEEKELKKSSAKRR